MKQIEVQPRTPGKKGVSRKLRAKGRVPGIIYGHKETPVPFSVDPKVFTRLLRDSEQGSNTVLELSGLSRPVTAMVKERQVHPVRRNLVHVDLIEVRADEVVTVKVPVAFSGRPAGVVAGGNAVYRKRTVRLKCTPDKIPANIPLDISGLKVLDSVRISDLALPEGVSAGEPVEGIVILIEAGRAAVEAADDEEAEAE